VVRAIVGLADVVVDDSRVLWVTAEYKLGLFSPKLGENHVSEPHYSTNQSEPVALSILIFSRTLGHLIMGVLCHQPRILTQ
jgi:hypothetical protein